MLVSKRIVPKANTSIINKGNVCLVWLLAPHALIQPCANTANPATTMLMMDLENAS